ncbi:hypothetical protein XH94_36940 [Bradyrhizobium zhanjiangense]|uniref:Uncharacterized protein n=1 Tax=Bradyrhizobium zhanjiangense TaxID=1325107 RepID=A0A4Q0RXL3_9BRAD|nr:hypothetical protein XH94_36940 [Bradyrhizobium zhanjiangense]
MLYKRIPRLFAELASRGDGRHQRLLYDLDRIELLLLDHRGLSRSTSAPLARQFGSIDGLPFTHS